MLLLEQMKAVAEKSSPQTNDFYISTLAPVHQRKVTRFGVWDGTMLIVLFVEVGIFMRLFLAN